VVAAPLARQYVQVFSDSPKPVGAALHKISVQQPPGSSSLDCL
jgi:hypothetical protein